MQRLLTMSNVSEDEEIKAAGLVIDYDEIAKKGVMSKEEGLISKWYGIYGSRQPGNFMIRITVPGGVLSSSQVRRIAATSRSYGQGILSITTRQAIQHHWVKLANLGDVLRELREEGLSTIHGCGDVTRNMAACPLAETCPHRRFNVRPFAISAARYLTDSYDLDNLPRKFKVTWSGCNACCAQPYMNCVGMIAVRFIANGIEKEGFRVVAGGGMGWKGYVAQELFSFVPKELASSVTRAIAVCFATMGIDSIAQRLALSLLLSAWASRNAGTLFSVTSKLKKFLQRGYFRQRLNTFLIMRQAVRLWIRR